MNNTNKIKRGFILITVLVFASVAVLVTSALISWAGTEVKSAQNFKNKEVAMEIAEAGVDYYRWHLAHAPTDYYDGKGSSSTGPYVHDYYDRDGVHIGKYSLTISAPPLGSSLVTVTATGTIDADPKISRTVRAQFAKPSLAKFSVFANSDMRFGTGTTVYGPLHSNGGIHFDGVAYNTVTSAKDTYSDPDYTEPNAFGVYTRVSPQDPYPPGTAPQRLDVFKAGRQFPVVPVDFTGLTSNFATMKTDAQASGKYLAPSGSFGYHLVLKTNHTYDLYKVTALNSAPTGCSNTKSQSGWGTWTIKTTGGQSFIGNYPYPSNGIMFIEDNVWVDGQINGDRLSIVAARFPVPTTLPSITVNSNLLYSDYSGADSLSLMAQGDFNVGLGSANTLRIDAAIIAQSGRAGRFYYGSSCNTGYIRSALTLYGMIGTNGRYGFAYTDGTGYTTRTIIYDSNLLYSPPPSFPLTTDSYVQVSWQEVTK